MDDMRFADVMQRERERLNRDRDEILNQQRELENKLAEIDREFAAIDAYETTKTGKSATTTRQPRGRGRSAATIKEASVAETGTRPQPGSRRAALLQVIGKERTVSAAAKSSSVWVSKATNLLRSRYPMPSPR